MYLSSDYLTQHFMNTLFFGENIIRLDSVDSTNDYLQKLILKTTVQEGTVVIANEQFSGKGQRGNFWMSESGKNLTLSIFLLPKFLHVSDNFLLNKIISLGVFDMLSEIPGVVINIKWPNDIYANGKKTGGILLENSVSGNFIQNSIAGIGLNVNQTEFDNLPLASSIKNIFTKEFDLNMLLSSLLSSLEKRYLQLRSNQLEKINRDYLCALYRLNEKSNFVFKKERITARITGVSREGKLQLQKDSGKVPFDFLLTVDIESAGEKSNVKLICEAELNVMLKMMVEKPLTNFFNILAKKLQEKYA